MIGITISSPNYSNSGIAEEARKRFMRHTGLNCFVLHTTHERNYTAKLQLSSIPKKGSVVFFDADLWFMKDVDLSPFDDKEEFIAVKDCDGHPYNCETWPDAFSYKDCKRLGMDTSKYFNGGFMIFNHRHVKIFDDALTHLRTKPEDFSDFGEQSAVNYAVQNSGVELKLLPVNYNTMIGGSIDIEDLCSDPYAIHAAGVPFEHKLDLLNFIIEQDLNNTNEKD
jgi:lipopolysaccharide biosynthesis glycosyltransferase